MAADKVNEEFVEVKTKRGGGGSSNHWNDQQYPTLVRPNKGVTAVCGSFIFCLLDDWEVITGCRK